MRQLRVPLYSKFLLWAGLNFLLILLVVFLFAPQGVWGLDLLLTQSVRERLTSIAHEMADELYQVAPAEWAATLARHRDMANVSFTARALNGPPRPPPPPRFGTPPDGGGPLPELGPRPPNFPIDIRHDNGTGYTVSIPAEGASHGGPPQRYIVYAHAVTLLALLHLLGITRELLFSCILLVMSALLWWPFIWRITRTVSNLSAATQSMSRGRLDTRVREARRDELGDLATAINTMAQRLEAALQGQRQFLADVAHEVISPVARMQIGLGILEDRVPERDAHAIDDVRDDLDQMAGMLNELLLFSRSGIGESDCAPVSVNLLEIIQNVVAAEADTARVSLDVAGNLQVAARPTLLSRALANLVRNADRYGCSRETPIDICAAEDTGRIKLLVQDRGPGVPDEALARLGEPFYRPELARSRATGGFGLGLAIVRRCIADCDGEVRFSNRDGGGFRAELTLNSLAERRPE